MKKWNPIEDIKTIQASSRLELLLMAVFSVAALLALGVGSLFCPDGYAQKAALAIGAGLILAVATLVKDVIGRLATSRQGSFNERAKAAQQLLQAARKIRHDAREVWNSSWFGPGSPRRPLDQCVSIDHFQDLGFELDFWLDPAAMRKFRDSVSKLDLSFFERREDLVAEITKHLEVLKADLRRELGLLDRA
jgi:hypothetical protein